MPIRDRPIRAQGGHKGPALSFIQLYLFVYILDVILMHILHGISMHVLDVLICMHILDVLLLLLATMVIAPLFGEFQPQSNNVAGSVAVPETSVLSPTRVLHTSMYI